MPNNTAKKLFKIGSQLLIEFEDNHQNRNIYRTRISEVNDAEIALQLPPAQSVPIEPQTKLAIYLGHVSQGYYFNAAVIAYQPGNPSLPPTLIISWPEQIATLSRRKFFRCDVELPFYYQDHRYQEHSGRVINLSASGLLAVVGHNPQLGINMVFNCRFEMPTLTEPLEFEGKIIRLDKTENPSEQGIALNFEDITEKFQNEVIKYLFQRQRELINERQMKAGQV